MEELPWTNRIGQGVESDLLLQGFLLGLKVNMDLKPLQSLRVLLHPHTFIDLVAQNSGPVQRLLRVEVVRMVRGGVSQDLLHQERILRHSLDGFEKVK